MLDSYVPILVTLDIGNIIFDVACHKGDERRTFKKYCKEANEYGGIFHGNKFYPLSRINLIEMKYG